jgi:hypothetical protein
MRKLLFALFLLVSSTAFAGGSKVAVCHYSADTDTWKLINVGEPAAYAHLANHGDVSPGDYYPDADGDGYGDGSGTTAVCPTPGYVVQAGDCNDGDAAINPGATEVCGDGIDNNCNAGVDEDCGVSCPCASDPYWMMALEGAPSLCTNNEIPSPQIRANWTNGGDSGTVGAYLYYDDGSCHVSESNSGYYTEQTHFSIEEFEACRDDIQAWALSNGESCAAQ